MSYRWQIISHNKPDQFSWQVQTGFLNPVLGCVKTQAKKVGPQEHGNSCQWSFSSRMQDMIAWYGSRIHQTPHAGMYMAYCFQENSSHVGSYLNRRVVLWRGYGLIVAPQKYKYLPEKRLFKGKEFQISKGNYGTGSSQTFLIRIYFIRNVSILKFAKLQIGSRNFYPSLLEGNVRVCGIGQFFLR